MTKKELIEKVEKLNERIAELESDIEHMNEYYVSQECADEMASQAIDDYINQKEADLRRREPEYHRNSFKLIHGGAA